jgi:hypothetical protein
MCAGKDHRATVSWEGIYARERVRTESRISELWQVGQSLGRVCAGEEKTRAREKMQKSDQN